MIYIVSGYRRSGTSMMMQAINASMTGGSLLYRPDMEDFNSELGEYQPNPGGLWEVGQAWYMRGYFLRRIPDNCFIKILYDGLPCLPQGSYKVMFMCRNEEDIKRSCTRVDKYLADQGYGLKANQYKPFDVFQPYNQDDIDHVVGICELRADIELIKVHFDDVIDNPIEVFESLHIPIDVDKAAATVDPKLRRFNGR